MSQAQLTPFARIVFPGPTRVGGLLMAPLSLGHWLLLESIESPYLVGAGMAGPGDAALALWVLERDWASAAEGLRRGRGSLRRRWLAWLYREDYELAAIAAGIRGHLARQSAGPRVWHREAGEQLQAPWAASLLARLTSQFGMSVAEALGLQLRVALWLSAARAEAEGALQWVSEAEREAAERAQATPERRPATAADAALFAYFRHKPEALARALQSPPPPVEGGDNRTGTLPAPLEGGQVSG